MIIYCCGCQKDVEARLTNGAEIYASRQDLVSLPFWICDKCENFVGCHHKTKNRTKPLGCIPTVEIRNARKHIHALLDPVWQSGKVSRSKLYKMVSSVVGYKYHTANLRTIEDAREAYRAIQLIKKQLL